MRSREVLLQPMPVEKHLFAILQESSFLPMKDLFRNIQREWFWLAPLLLAIATVALFLFYEATQYFPDPDSFYHARISEQMAHTGLIQNFTWLPHTTLADSFADQHFGYHLFLIPFVTAFDPLIGIKIATVILALAFILVFYYFLKSFGVRWPMLFSFALLLVNPFTFRLGLAKATSPALIIFFLSVWALMHLRWKWLLFFAFLYTFIHGGFPLLGIALLFFFSVSLLVNTTRNIDHRQRIGKLFAGIGRHLRFRKRQNLHLKLILAVLVGFTFGVVLNPYFPENLRFLWDQFVEIGILNAQKEIGVGGEWYPYAVGELLPNTIVLSVALVVALPTFFLTLKRQSKQSWTLLLLAVFLFLFTLKSRRYIEYYVPIGMAYAAFAITDAIGRDHLAKHLPFLPSWQRGGAWARALLIAVVTVIGILFPTILVRDIVTERQDFTEGFRLSTFERSMQALKIISTPGDIVLHSDWDEFPILFYYNQQNRYIAGLDPTFFYLKNPEKHRAWVDITTGKFEGDPTEVIQNDLQASWVFLTKDHVGMDAIIRNRTTFPLVYEDDEAKIYDARHTFSATPPS